MSEPRTPDFGETVRKVFDRQGFMRHVGARVDHAAPGEVTLSVDRRDALLQHHGFFHGGVIAFLVDNATGAAAGPAPSRPASDLLTRRIQDQLRFAGHGANGCVAQPRGQTGHCV